MGRSKVRTLILSAALGVLLVALVGILSVRLAMRNGYQGFTIEGSDMSPTLESRHYVMFNTMVYKLRRPEQGDVVVFHSPENPSRDLIRRVIGVPGDEVNIRSGIVFIDGKPLYEPYVTTKDSSNMDSVHLREEEFFVLGDNRQISMDSRSWGPVPEKNIFGRLGDPYLCPMNWWCASDYHQRL